MYEAVGINHKASEKVLTIPVFSVATKVVLGSLAKVYKWTKSLKARSKKISTFAKGTGKLDDLISAKSLGKGSTGRTVANSLDEQLAMKEVLSDSLDGAEYLRKFKMGDTRWSAKDGWQKMQRIIETSDSTKINIHFNYNKVTGAFDDFKFKQTILPEK